MILSAIAPEAIAKRFAEKPEEETEDKSRRTLAELLGLNRKGADDHVGTDL